MKNYFEENNLNKLKKDEVSKLEKTALKGNNLSSDSSDKVKLKSIVINPKLKKEFIKTEDISNTELDSLYNVKNISKEGQIQILRKVEGEIEILEEEIKDAEKELYDSPNESNQYFEIQELNKLERRLEELEKIKREILENN